MTSPVHGIDGGNPRGTKTTGGKLSGSPRLTFARDPAGDTITRSEGTWDAGDGFAIGQWITISGALNAGIHTITSITNGGKTLVLDAREIVAESVTAALSIASYVTKPPADSLVNNEITPGGGKRIKDALPDVFPMKGKVSPDDGKPNKDAPLELLPIESDSGPGEGKQPGGALPGASPIKSKASPGDGKRKESAPLELLPIESDARPSGGTPVAAPLIKGDDSPAAVKQSSEAPAKEAPPKVDRTPGAVTQIKEAPLELLPIEGDDSPGNVKQSRDVPPKASPIKGDDSPATIKQTSGAPTKEAPPKPDSTPVAVKQIKEAPLELSPIESADGSGEGKQTGGALPGASPIKSKGGPGDARQSGGTPAEASPKNGDDSPGAVKQTSQAPVKEAPIKAEAIPTPPERMIAGQTTAPPSENKASPGDCKKTTEAPAKVRPTKVDSGPAPAERKEAAQTSAPAGKKEGIADPGKRMEAAQTMAPLAKSDPGHAPNERINGAPAKTAPRREEETSPEDSRRVTDAPGRAIRSGMEIAKMLEAICEEQLAVTAYPDKGELLFVSKMLAVDPDLGRIILDYSQWKPANSALLVCEQVLFHCERKNRHIQFLTGTPTEVVFAGSAGIQVGFPQFVLDLQQRAYRRFRVASLPSLWCVIKVEGSDPIVANVTDISRGGLGGIVHDPGVVLKPGTIIRDCQITGTSLKRPIEVSVEVRRWKTIRAPDGTLSKRVGCRFVASSMNLQELIDVFEIQLDDDGPAD